MKITLIAAVDNNGAIGKDNKLAWHIPKDFLHFQRETKYKPIVMGRKTLESIGKPLSSRINLILTRNKEMNVNVPLNARIFHSVEAILSELKHFDGELVVIGGEDIYNQFIEIADKVILTKVDTVIEGADTFFPSVIKDPKIWKEVKSVKDSDENYNFEYVWYEYNSKGEV